MRTVAERMAASMSRPVVLDSAPHAELDGDGKGEWHENAEMRRLVRPMTAEEYADHLYYDRSAYRARERMRRYALVRAVEWRGKTLVEGTGGVQ